MKPFETKFFMIYNFNEEDNKIESTDCHVYDKEETVCLGFIRYSERFQNLCFSTARTETDLSVEHLQDIINYINYYSFLRRRRALRGDPEVVSLNGG